MNTEIIKRVVANVSGETVSDVIDSIIENLKADKKLRENINADFWRENFTPEELKENRIILDGDVTISDGCYSAFGRSNVTVLGGHINMFNRGMAQIKSGTGHTYGTSCCRAEGNSSVRAYDYSRMRLHMKAVGEYHDHSQGEVYGEADFTAYDFSMVRSTGKSTGMSRGEAIILQTGKTSCKYTDKSIGHLHGDAAAEAWGKSQLALRNESKANLFEDATADALNDSRVIADDRSMVVAKECASVVTRGGASAQLHDNCRGEAVGNSLMTIHDNCRANISENATLNMYDKTQAAASGSVRVIMHGDNILDVNSDGVVYQVKRDAKGIVRNNHTMELVLHGHNLKVIEK